MENEMYDVEQVTNIGEKNISLNFSSLYRGEITFNVAYFYTNESY